MISKFNQLVERLIEPRRLVIVACLMVAMGLVADYVQVQREVDRTLALRQGPPPAVALQAFRPAQDVGPANEVQVFAEADFSKSVVLTRPGSAGKDRVVIVPLLEVSEIGASLIDVATDRARSALAAQVSRRTLSPEPVESPIVYGFVLHAIAAGEPTPEPAMLTKAAYGKGLNGAVVAINGSRVHDDEFALMASGAFTALGLAVPDEMLSIAPYVSGRVAYMTAPIDASSHKWVYGFATILVMLALYFSLRGTARGGRKLRMRSFDHDDPSNAPDAAHRTLHPKFAPLPTQEELSAPRIEAVDDQVEARPSRLRALAELVLRRRQNREVS